MRTSLKAYLDSLDLTAEEKATLAPILANEKVTKAIDKELASAQTELSRGLDLAKEETKKRQDYFAEMQTWRQGVNAELAEARKGVEDGKVLTTRAQERIRGLVNDGVIEAEAVKDILEGSAVNDNGGGTRERRAVEGDVIPKGMVKEEDFLKFSDSIFEFVPLMNSLGYEYQSLFGKPPDPAVMRNLPRLAREQNKTLAQVAEEAFKFTDRRAELSEAARVDNENKIRADERSKVLSEVKNPTNGGRPAAGWASPVLPLSTPEKVATDTAAHNARGVLNAVGAYREHKYAPTGT